MVVGGWETVENRSLPLYGGHICLHTRCLFIEENLGELFLFCHLSTFSVGKKVNNMWKRCGKLFNTVLLYLFYCFYRYLNYVERIKDIRYNAERSIPEALCLFAFDLSDKGVDLFLVDRVDLYLVRNRVHR